MSAADDLARHEAVIERGIAGFVAAIDQLDDLMASCRDVLDVWGDGDVVDPDAVDMRMQSMRRALFELRQTIAAAAEL